MYLHHIRKRCERVAGCVQAGREAFFGNVVYQDAVMRDLEIIGSRRDGIGAAIGPDCWASE